MLDLKFIRENLEVVKNKLSQRNSDIDLDRLVEIDLKRREIIQEVETLRNERNTVSEIIAAKKKEKKDASNEISRMKEVSQKIKEVDTTREEIEATLRDLLLRIPNLPDGYW